ncbi:NAD(P)/FAD-dependent oxidoreductase [Acidicapsa dinghuensis]|uniref:NAD(P)/FAD-dependent oxidoreductase n=1 Tax=Acidicapsa dinghuensis TaxID=2218256 RepID=A0ABW1EBM5_9BACT|nr:FAD-dependent oxidoreductase [Acidicapsa dinghuensis]
MVETQLNNPLVIETDAVVLGAGLAGISAAIHLARKGFRVLCIEQRTDIRNSVGESLDWSAPELFAKLGLSMEALIAAGAATWKRHITVIGQECGENQYLPGAWLAESPWNVEIRTLHLDRERVDACLRDTAQRIGVSTLHERVADFCILDEPSTRHRRVIGLRTQQGTFVRASWFIDASGSDASLLARRFRLKPVTYGPRKVAIWAHLPTQDWADGTALYMLSSPGKYMEWIWEIPIQPGISSIGYIASGASIKRQRSKGLRPQRILADKCANFPRLQSLVEQTGAFHTRSTTFTCRTYRGICGANWIIVGEAASQSDPITGNGVTAALRHAEEATALICRYRDRGTIPPFARAVYDHRVSTVGRYFNSLIENLFYQPALRDRVGLFPTARIYTVPAWLLNLVYTRLRPDGVFRTLLISFLMSSIRLSVWTAFQGGSLVNRLLPNSSPDRMSTAEEQSYAF